MIANLKIAIIILFGFDPQIPQMPNCDEIRYDETICSACNVYHEARGETHAGKIAVASVTHNRVEHSKFPDTFCRVVWQRRQYSWTKDGRSDRVRDAEQWEEAYLISLIMVKSHLNDEPLFTDITKGSLWYHADYVQPYWSVGITPEITLGRHRFYREIKG